MSKRQLLPEIKPCPFCGTKTTQDTKAVEKRVYPPDHLIGKMYSELALVGWRVYCHATGCDAQGPVRKTKRGAINIWNSVVGKHEYRSFGGLH